MKNIKLVIEYCGAEYCGWQVQNNGLAIQHVLEEQLSRLTGEQIRVNGSGRTDAGVHALGQTANFKTCSSIPPEGFAAALNSSLPDDISIVSASEVPEDWHARFSAVGKHYRYVMCARKQALMHSRAALIRYTLDVDLMREAAERFCGEHDFAAFMASGSSVSSTVRTIHKVNISRKKMGINEDDLIVFDVWGNGFLYNMVRIMAGTLIDIGRGHLDISCIDEAYRTGKRSVLGHTAPAEGLYLVEVFYDPIEK